MKKLSAIILFCLATLSAWAQVTFTASVQGGSTVEAGTRFMVEYKLNSTCDEFDCDVTSSGLRKLSGPYSSSYMSTSIINGSSTVSRTTTYTFVLMAEKEGTYKLPAARAVSGGKVYMSNELTVNAIPADPSRAQASQNNARKSRSVSPSTSIGKDDILLAVDLSKTKVYEGEALIATLKLYSRHQSVSTVTDIKFPDLEGFTVQEIDIPQNAETSLEKIDNYTYSAYPIRQWLLFPQHSGNIVVKPASLTAVVRVHSGPRSFWDDPFSLYQNVQVPVKSAERVVKVNALPGNKPASYLNGVGEFTIKSELTSNKLKANDATIYRITLSGTGNLKYVREPKPDFPADFEVFDPKSDLQSSVTAFGMKGKKVIEYTVIPRFGGKFTIPPVEFSYFSTNLHKYVTIKTEAQTIEVESDGSETSSGAGSVDFSGTTQERIKVLGSDIRYLHPLDADELTNDKDPIFGSFGYWLWFILPSAAFIALIIFNRHRLKLRSDAVLQRTRKANKVANRRLKSAAAALSQHQESQFYESLHKAMAGYVADKLNIPLSELTGDSIREELAKRNVPEDVINDFADVLSTCEFARYAPSADAQAMDMLYQKASATIGRLEKTL